MTANGSSISWKWLAGILMSALLIGMAAWASTLQGRVNTLEATKAEKADVDRIYQRLGTIETDVKELLKRRP